MGRAIVTPKKQAIPPGFMQELNLDLMEDLWYALAAAKHPEAFEDEHSHLSLHELFDGPLADVTWADFWHAFPYELREQGDCLDEIDALGLLLSTHISRSRFERHFEQLATTSLSSSTSSSSGTSQQTAALPVRLASVNRSSSSRALARAFGAVPPAPPQPLLGDYPSNSLTGLMAMNTQEAAGRRRRADDQFPLQYTPEHFMQYPPEQQSWINTVVAAAGAGASASAGAGQPRQQPARRMSRRSLAVPPPSGQQQQQQLQPRQQHVAYVSPAAPGRTTATTRTPGRTAGLYAGLGPGRAGQQQQQQQQRVSQQQHPVPGTEQYTALMDLLQQELGTSPPLPDSPRYHWELPSVFAGADPLGPPAEFQLPAHDDPLSSSRVRSLVSTIQAALAGHVAAAAGAAGAGAAARPSSLAAVDAAGSSMQPPRTNTTNAHTAARATAAAAAAGGGDGESAAAAGAGAFPPSSWLRAWRGMLDTDGGRGIGSPHAPMAGPPLFRAPPAAAAAAAAGDPADVEEAAAAASRGEGEDAGWEAQMLRRLLPDSQGGSSSSSGDDEEGMAGQGGGDRLAAAAARLPAGGEPEGFARAMRFLARDYAPSPGTIAAAEAAIAANAAVAANIAAAAAPPAGSAVPAGGSQRLTGQRRTWQEACDPEGFEQERQQQQQQQQARAATGDQASPAVGAGGAAAAVADAAAADAGTSAGQGVVGGSSSGGGAGGVSSSRQRVDYSRVWRAVHEWLTGEDEDLLELVSQVVPYSLAGRSLKTQEETLQQLRALAGSRAVPRKVVTAVADRLYQPCASGEAHLVRLTASSGFSKRAAAAAAVLDCCEGHGMLPFYIPLAGLCTADAVEAAVMQGLFGGGQQPHTVQQTQTQQQQQQQAAVAGAPAGAADAGAAHAAAAGSSAGEAAAVAAAAAAGASGGLLAGDLTLADMGAIVGLMESNEAVFRPTASPAAAAGTPPAQLRGLVALDSLSFPPPVGAAAAPAAPAAAGTPTQAQLQGLDRDLEWASIAPSVRAATVAAVAAGAGRSGPQNITGTPSSRGGEDIGDQLAAHLTLLGRCHSRQAMLLWLDEVDAAMMPDDGRPLRDVLMQLLYRLPQAVVVMTSSSGLEAWRDAAVLRQVGQPLVQELTDGKLVLVEHRLPKSLLHPRCYDYIL